MKKLLIVVGAIALAAWLISLLAGWVISRFWAGEAVATSAARPWPGGMGTIDSVADRFPPLQANASSVKLAALAEALPRDEAVGEFVQTEIARGELTIGEPPALPDLSAIRELLLGGQVVWERRGGIVGVGDAGTSEMRAAQMTVARALIASALAKARANDASAWDELRAVWNLARSLDAQPQMMLQTASLSMARMINAVAWKMPLPAPAWAGELRERDHVRPLLAAFQYQTASYWEDGARLIPTRLHAGWLEHDRRIAETMFDVTGCDVNAPLNKHGADLRSVWRRAFRYRAEREATANALHVREGKPIEPASRCSSGGWTFDGTTLRFNREIPTAAPDTAMPLVLRLEP